MQRQAMRKSVRGHGLTPESNRNEATSVRTDCKATRAVDSHLFLATKVDFETFW